MEQRCHFKMCSGTDHIIDAFSIYILISCSFYCAFIMFINHRLKSAKSIKVEIGNRRISSSPAMSGQKSLSVAACIAIPMYYSELNFPLCVCNDLNMST